MKFMNKILNKRLTFYVGLSLFCCLYWFIDSVWSFISFEENLSVLIFSDPKSLIDTLMLKVSPYQAVSRLIVTFLFFSCAAVFYELMNKKYKAEAAFKESETKYRIVVNHANEGILIVQDFKIKLLNPKILDIIGYEEEYLLETPVTDFIYKDDKEKVLSLYETWLIHREPLLSHSFRIINKDGNIIWVQLNTTSIQWDKKPAALNLITDISEEKKLAEQLKRAEKMEALGLLAGGVAHDLNNILGGLVSYPDLMLMDLPDDSPLRDPILIMQNSGKRAAKIVQDLLNLARRDHTATDIVNLNDVINDFLVSPEFIKINAQHAHITVHTNLDPELINIVGSSVHLNKVLMNLCLNAAEACPETGVLRISTENRHVDHTLTRYDDIPKGDYTVLTVQDNGQGIDSHDLGRIFEPFYTKKIMGHSGTGLGMAVVWGTVKDHKGFIDVESRPNQGTTFTLYFPSTDQKSKPTQTPQNMSAYMGNGEFILVVDDMDEQRMICSMILSKLGYTVHGVKSGEDAVDYLKTHTADLVILDMIMDPGIDGLETYKQITQIHPKQKALIASGFSETKQVEELLMLGAGAYIRKPYTLEQIGLAVRNELSSHNTDTNPFVEKVTG